jgi:hypothetical protein
MTKTNPPPMIHAMPWAHRLLSHSLLGFGPAEMKEAADQERPPH